jgi:hypothetical protein
MKLSLSNGLVGLLTILCLAMALGCGGSSTSANQPVTMSGNFGFAATSQTGTNTFQLGGPVQSGAGNSVSGTMNVDASVSTCFDFFTALTFTGTLSPSGQLSLTSSPYVGEVFNLTGTLSSDGMTIASGSYSITGGCAGGDHGTLSGFRVPLINGTYTGTFPAAGATMNISAALSQGTTNGFLLGATVTFSNATACSLTSAKALGGESGFIAGADVRANLFDATLTAIAGFHGVVSDSTGKTIKGTLGIASGPCAGTSVPLTLTMP